MTRLRARTLAQLGSLLCLALASVVRASPLFEQAGDFGGLGGQAGRAESTGASAAYFNPALLDRVAAGLTVGVLVLHSEIGARVGERGGTQYDVPQGLANASRADGTRLDSYPIATDALRDGVAASALKPALPARPRQRAGSGHRTYSYEAVGLVGKLFQDRLTLGFYALLPNSDFMQLRSFYADEREQYFSNSLHPELYGDRLTALSVALAAGVRVTRSLALGIGATVGFRAGADAPAFVADASRLQDILLDIDVGVSVAVSPHVGVSYRPLERLRFTGTLHAPQKVEIDVGFRFLLATGLEQGSSLKFVQDYQPWQASFGADWDVVAAPSGTWSLGAGLLYGRWSRYIDRHGVRPAAPYAFRDTLTGTGGLRYVGERFSLSTDVQYKPTPVPPQTGRTNYLDNDRAGLSFSVEYRWTWLETPLRVAGQLQAQRMLPRAQRKRPTPSSASGNNSDPFLVRDEVPNDAEIAVEPLPGREGLQTNNPGWPGFSSSGYLLSAGLALAVTF